MLLGVIRPKAYSWHVVGGGGQWCQMFSMYTIVWLGEKQAPREDQGQHCLLSNALHAEHNAL